MAKEKTSRSKTAARPAKTAVRPVKAASRAPAKRKKPAGLKKQYFKTKTVCRVTFTLPCEAAPSANVVCLVGDFNNWSISAHPMRRLTNGDFTLSIDLERDRQYQFRYLIDECRWENDWHADGYAATPYGDCENSVVIV